MEEILKLNSSTKDQIKFKEQLSLAVLKYISFVNKKLAESNFENGLDQYTKYLKLIIGGGAAFRYYIKRTPKTIVLETHDYDLRLFLDMKPSKSPLFKEGKEKIEEWMLDISSAIAIAFTDFLNLYVKESKVKFNPVFKTVHHGFLTTIEYKLNGENDSIIDIVPHIPSHALFYGPLDIKKDQLLEDFKKADFTGIVSRQGFFKSSLIYNKDSLGIYYVTLGYIVWDTVRMINYIIDSKKFQKFERYLTKYKVLLSALSRPELYMKCESSKKFINSCNKTVQFCNIAGQKLSTKEELIQYGIDKKILPDDDDWYKAFLKMEFSDICKAIS